MLGFSRTHASLLILAVAAVLSACGSTSINRAPVEDRGATVSPSVGADGRIAGVKQPPGFENAGKPGYYAVKPGETLIRIGLETGQNHKDIIRWNALDNPDKIEVGQILRVIPPLETDSVAVAKPITTTVVSSVPLAAGPLPSKPIEAVGASGTGVAANTVVNTPATANTSTTATTTAAAGSAVVPAINPGSEDDLDWIWPSKRSVIAGFDEVKNKGLDISGAAGDPVVAAADGKVVYADAGLRGYGKLIILKHNNTYLTAYAHNQNLLVKEDQVVKKGQKIAEMGNTDADRVKLHFELRRQGKPVDPAKYLPAK
jgi:lipoprotein NlpD